jgi:hypothetical protein
MLHQRVDEELAAALEQWIELGEESAVARVIPVVP